MQLTEWWECPPTQHCRMVSPTASCPLIAYAIVTVSILGDCIALLFLPCPVEESKSCLLSTSVMDYFCYKAIYVELLC